LAVRTSIKTGLIHFGLNVKTKRLLFSSVKSGAQNKNKHYILMMWLS